MRKWYLLLFSLLAAFALYMMLTFFYSQNRSPQLALKKPIHIVFKSIERKPMDFWNVVEKGVSEAGREFGIDVEYFGPRYEKEISRQLMIFRSVIRKDPPLIILAASDYVRLNPVLEEADKRGIPIITLDSGVSSDLPVSFVATDNLHAGRKAGVEMARLLEHHPRKEVAIVSHIKETATAIEREEGVKMALAGHTIVGSFYCDVEQEKAYRVTMDLLKNPRIGGIVALNEVVSLGVARALEETGMADEVLMVGFDNAVKELEYLEAGIIKATVVQRPYNMGYLAVKTAVDYLQGRRVKKFYDTGSVLITKENMFRREYQELLFPFTEGSY